MKLGAAAQRWHEQFRCSGRSAQVAGPAASKDCVDGARGYQPAAGHSNTKGRP